MQDPIGTISTCGADLCGVTGKSTKLMGVVVNTVAEATGFDPSVLANALPDSFHQQNTTGIRR